MEFILFMKVCAIFIGECSNDFINPKPYPTFKECVMDGYHRSIEIYKELDSDKVNEEGLAIMISCRERTTT